MRTFVLALALAACGGGSKSGDTTPAPPPPADVREPPTTGAARLELGEISLLQDGRGLAVHANGGVEVVDGASRTPLGTLTADGLFTLPDGDAAQLQDDGTLMSKDGPAPFKLEDETLVVGAVRLTLDANSVVQGAPTDMSALKITGVNSRGTRRTALLLIGFMTLAK